MPSIFTQAMTSIQAIIAYYEEKTIKTDIDEAIILALKAKLIHISDMIK